MRRERPPKLIRSLTASEEWGILACWHQGFDTYEISLRLGVHESEIANRLMRLRAMEKGEGDATAQTP